MRWTAHYGILKRKLPADVHRELANIPIVPEVETSYTISLDTPEKMGEGAKENARLPILKLKLGGDAPDLERIEPYAESRRMRDFYRCQ